MARKASGQEFIEHKASIMAKISEHFNNADISDVTLSVGDQVFAAHRFVLATQSKVFATMLMGENWKESEEKKIVLQESPEGEAAFSDFLRFFYIGTITLTIDNVCGIHTLADKYDVPALKDDCVGFMKDVLTGIHGDALKAGLLWLRHVEVFLSDMISMCYNAIRTNFVELEFNPPQSEYSNLFKKLTFDQVKKILTVQEVQEELVLFNEEILLSHIDNGKWAKRLLPLVRFYNIDIDCLQDYESSNNLTKYYHTAYQVHAERSNIATKEHKRRRLSDGSEEVTCSCGTDSLHICPHINPRLYLTKPYGELIKGVPEDGKGSIRVEALDLSDLTGFAQRLTLRVPGDENPEQIWTVTVETDYSGDPICEKYIVKPAKSHARKKFTLAITAFKCKENSFTVEYYMYVIKHTGLVATCMRGEDIDTIKLTSPLRFKGIWRMDQNYGIGMTVLLHK